MERVIAGRVRRDKKRNEIFFFSNETATTEIYTICLRDELPIYTDKKPIKGKGDPLGTGAGKPLDIPLEDIEEDPEEHTTALPSRGYLVCRLLLEKHNQLLFLLFL